MAKEKNNKMMLLLIIAAIAIFIFMSKPSIDTGIDDQGVSLRVFAYDSNKELIGELQTAGAPLQATITFPGGDPQYGVDFIKIESTISHSSGVKAYITSITGSNSLGTNVYNPGLAAYTKSFTLDVGQNNVQTSDFIPITALPNGAITFTLNVVAHFFDAKGTQVNIPGIVGTVIITKASDICLDGTPEGQCSSDNRGKYCLNGGLVDGATAYSCDCCTSVGDTFPCGWEPQPGNTNVCSNQLCGAGVIAGQCITSTLNTQYPKFCELDGTQTNACNRCDTCANDYYTNPSLGCSIGSDPATCTYTIYSSNIAVSLGGEGTGGGAGGTVQFRTTNTNYNSGTIAFHISTCGSDLSEYGYFEGSAHHNPVNTCSTFGSPIISNLPGTLIQVVNGVGPINLHDWGDVYRVCQSDGGVGRITRVFSASVVGTQSPTSVDPSKEVSC